MKHQRLLLLSGVLVVAGAIAMVTTSCSGDETSNPATTTNDASLGPDGTTGVDSPTSLPDTASPPPDAAEGGDAAAALKPPGCFQGKPTTNLELLNACTTADYVPFDNCARLGICDGGALPALRPEGGVSDAAADTGT